LAVFVTFAPRIAWRLNNTENPPQRRRERGDLMRSDIFSLRFLCVLGVSAVKKIRRNLKKLKFHRRDAEAAEIY
jgi:hypothetical protein